jgi:hypothetical protein
LDLLLYRAINNKPIGKEIKMADIKLHDVSKIEVLKRRDVSSNLSVRTLVIYNTEYSKREGRRVATETEITCFLDDKSSGKIVHNKESWR